MTRVAIIGAGPGGLASARYLKARGFAPQIFDSHSGAGGQWDHTNPNSGVWPQMVTNTFLEATRFSDLDYPDGTPLFPHNSIVLKHLRDYAARFGLLGNARFRHRLDRLAQHADGYELTFATDAGEVRDVFPRVVIATGRYNTPKLPPISGLAGFSGPGGVQHTFEYKDPHRFQGQQVIVAGGSISALEIASDLSMLGAAKVYLSQRRQRYVFPKMVHGTPLEYFVFTYGAGTLIAEGTEAQKLRLGEQNAKRLAGDPSRYGAPPVHPEFAKAGTTGSQHYLNLVAEGRVTPTPWIAKINGRRATLTDGSEVEADAIIIGTGFDLSLPFLSEEIAATLNATPRGLDLHEFTLHPDLPGLALIGLWMQQGSYPTVLEQQARYLAYTWSGVVNAAEADQRAGVDACIRVGHHTDDRSQSEMALRFARLCGTDPIGQFGAEIDRIIRKSATTSVLYRLAGPDALPDGPAQLQRQFARYGPPAKG